mmetsp:Transcript_45223/g.106513  ORF Transcript_45223/g.106513 Transcript_45223/m.106513 type:complete len:175 (+) Transcript_45223:199-723(+)
MAAPRQIGLQELRGYFSLPEKEVAAQLGVCLTSLKKLCRAVGLHRWPYRKVESARRKKAQEEGTAEESCSRSPSEASGASTLATPRASSSPTQLRPEAGPSVVRRPEAGPSVKRARFGTRPGPEAGSSWPPKPRRNSPEIAPQRKLHPARPRNGAISRPRLRGNARLHARADAC